MSLTVEELATAYHGAWVALDPDAIVALHSANTVFTCTAPRSLRPEAMQ